MGQKIRRKNMGSVVIGLASKFSVSSRLRDG